MTVEGVLHAAFDPSNLAPATMRRLTPLVLFGVILSAAIAVGVVAGGGDVTEPSPSAVALELSHEVMSPFCPGLTLAACPSSAAYDLRREIRARLEQGDSRDAVVADLIEQFGPAVNGTPPVTGYGSVVWAIPFVLAIGLSVAIRVATRRGEPTPGETLPEPSRLDLFTRLDDELDQMD